MYFEFEATLQQRAGHRLKRVEIRTPRLRKGCGRLRDHVEQIGSDAERQAISDQVDVDMNGADGNTADGTGTVADRPESDRRPTVRQ